MKIKIKELGNEKIVETKTRNELHFHIQKNRKAQIHKNKKAYSRKEKYKEKLF